MTFNCRLHRRRHLQCQHLQRQQRAYRFLERSLLQWALPQQLRLLPQQLRLLQ
jgi:hypothetical protein